MSSVLKNLDCIEGLETIEDNSVDLLLTDPPYNISMKSGFHTMGRQGVDFGEWDKNSIHPFQWLPQSIAKLKKGGSAVIFNDYKEMGVLRGILESHGCTIKELLIWQKPNPMPRNRERLYVTSIEVAIWAVKGKGWTFNRQRSNYENAVFNYGTVSARTRQHPTQKPLDLICDLVRIHSNEGDVVLDPFSGSGTVAVACERLNREYIAFELDKGYYDLSVVRLNQEKALSHGVFI